MNTDKQTRPSKNFTDKNRTEREHKNFMSENFKSTNSIGENSTSANSAANNSTSKNSPTENSISANSAGENSTNENFVNENSATENSASKKFTDKNSAAARSIPHSELISVRDLVLRYGRSEILNIPSLDLNTSGITALLGSNGSGKSTLLRILAFLQRPSSGSVELWGQQAPLCRRCGRSVYCCPSPYF